MGDDDQALPPPRGWLTLSGEYDGEPVDVRYSNAPGSTFEYEGPPRKFTDTEAQLSMAEPGAFTLTARDSGTPGGIVVEANFHLVRPEPASAALFEGELAGELKVASAEVSFTCPVMGTCAVLEEAPPPV
jgi:hypothetical protein